MSVSEVEGHITERATRDSFSWTAGGGVADLSLFSFHSFAFLFWFWVLGGGFLVKRKSQVGGVILGLF